MGGVTYIHSLHLVAMTLNIVKLKAMLFIFNLNEIITEGIKFYRIEMKDSTLLSTFRLYEKCWVTQ